MAIQPISHGPGSFTYADLERTTADGNRYELADGALYVTPRPNLRHQEIAWRLGAFLAQRLPPSSVALPEVELLVTERTVKVPDLVVVEGRPTGQFVSTPPSLVIEILSPATRVIDLHEKTEVYADFGIPAYWIVDPVAETITALRLDDGVYVESDSTLATDAAAAIFG